MVSVPLTIHSAQKDSWTDQARPEDASLPGQGCPAPTLSSTSPEPSFHAAYQQADEGAEGVLALTISSKLSGTYASAKTAADAFTVAVEVFDARSVTMGEGLAVIAAAEEAAAGATLDAPGGGGRRPDQPDPGLRRAGRPRAPPARDHPGGAQALLGSLLSIKPVIVVKDGEVAEESKQRTRRGP